MWVGIVAVNGHCPVVEDRSRRCLSVPPAALFPALGTRSRGTDGQVRVNDLLLMGRSAGLRNGCVKQHT